MEINLLGPMQVRCGADPVSLPGRAEQAVLAVLALSAGRAVPASRLIDDLWEDDRLPADPANALQLRVSKLRRALTDACGDDLVRKESAGYVLDVEPATVDAHRFAAALARARGIGDPGEAAGVYREALETWRGQPLAEFGASRWSVLEAGKLEELRHRALAELADRLLTLGAFDDVVAELEPTVAADPTRERLVGQLMTALFNGGRQREALEVYARTRSVLAEELGVDPSRDLRAVMEQILRQDLTIPGTVAADGADGAMGDPVRPEGVVAGNLPRRTTSFVGRDDDTERATRLLGAAGLVTMVGPGGAGKTTLAVEVARGLEARFRHGAWLVRLAPVTDGREVPHAVADALDLGLEGGTAARLPVELLVRHLADRELLLVLDNCEHVVEEAATMAEALLARCPGVRLLATSREALAIPGEVQLVVSPLPVPDEHSAPEAVRDCASVELFLDRARAADPDRVFDADAMHDVAAICRQLDGIPLALELAAARLSSLSTREVVDRMRDRFALLTRGSRTSDARQQTLRGAVDWSHGMLSDDEQVAFRRLAVFRGGWSLEAAEAVLPGADLLEESVLDLLDGLVRKSLVVAEEVHGGTRYRLLETLRQYAEERLVSAPDDEHRRVADAHADHFLALAEAAEYGLRGSRQAAWLATLRREQANVGVALDWLTGRAGDVERAQRMAGSLGLYWHMGRHLEGRRVLGSVLALPGGPAVARGRALQALALVERPRACIVHPSEQCAAAARESLGIFEAHGDDERAALSRLLLAVEGVGADPDGEYAALLDTADDEFTRRGDAWGRAVVAFVRMEIRFKRGDEATARAAAEHAVGLFRALADGWGLSAVLYHYGYGLQRFGAFADSVVLLMEAIDVAAAAGVHNTVQWATADLGLALLALGRLDEAANQFARAGEASQEVGDDAGRLIGEYGQGLLAERAGDHAAARPRFERAQEGFARLGVWLAHGLALAGTARCDAATGDLDSARARYASLLQLARTSGEVTLVLLGLEGMARVTVDADPTEATVLLGRATALRERLDRPAVAEERHEIEQTRSRAQALLGAAAFEAALARGASADPAAATRAP